VVCQFPFEFREGLIWLKVGVQNSPKPLNMLLDSGANVSVINLEAAHRLGLKLGQAVQVDGVHASTTGYWPEHVSGGIGGVVLPRDFLAVDLAELGQASGCAVDGLLGADFLAQHVVRIDFAGRKIQLLSGTSQVAQDEDIPIRLNQGALQTKASVNGSEPKWVRLDTGCDAAMHWVGVDNRPGRTPGQMAVALTKMWIPISQAKVQIGRFTFDGVPTGLHSAEIFPGESGLLGNGLLSRFSAVTIDVQAGQLLLEKGTE
jgi:hypothetical protein